jgi:hypothetical protein
MLLLLLIRDLFKVDDIGADILCDLLDLELPEMGQLDLDLPSGNGNNTVHGLPHTFADLHPLPNIDFHGGSLSGLVKQNICYTNWFTVYCINPYDINVWETA